MLWSRQRYNIFAIKTLWWKLFITKTPQVISNFWISFFLSTQLRKNEKQNVWKDAEREREGEGGVKKYNARSVLCTCIIVTERFKRRYLTFMYMYAFLYTKSARLWNGCFIGQFYHQQTRFECSIFNRSSSHTYEHPVA